MITIFGRGFPFKLEALSDNVISWTLNAGTAMAMTSAGVISATTFSGSSIDATTLVAASFSGSTVSGGSTPLTFAGGGSGTIGSQVTSGNRFLRVVIGASTYYVPCFLTYAGSGGAV